MTMACRKTRKQTPSNRRKLNQAMDSDNYQVRTVSKCKERNGTSNLCRGHSTWMHRKSEERCFEILVAAHRKDETFVTVALPVDFKMLSMYSWIKTLKYPLTARCAPALTPIGDVGAYSIMSYRRHQNAGRVFNAFSSHFFRQATRVNTRHTATKR